MKQGSLSLNSNSWRRAALIALLSFFAVAFLTAILPSQVFSWLGNGWESDTIKKTFGLHSIMLFTLAPFFFLPGLDYFRKRYFSTNTEMVNWLFVGWGGVIVLDVFGRFVIERMLGPETGPWLGAMSHPGSLQDGILVVLTVIILAPINEEILLRGFLLDVMFPIKPHMSVPIAVNACLNGGAFALMHAQYGVSAKLEVFLLGAWFTIVRQLGGNLLISICVHSFAGAFGYLLTLYVTAY